eukprot:Selendium_serpulae@DN5410_c4_g1_i4.p1
MDCITFTWKDWANVNRFCVAALRCLSLRVWRAASTLSPLRSLCLSSRILVAIDFAQPTHPATSQTLLSAVAASENPLASRAPRCRSFRFDQPPEHRVSLPTARLSVRHTAPDTPSSTTLLTMGPRCTATLVPTLTRWKRLSDVTGGGFRHASVCNAVGGAASARKRDWEN